MSRGVLVTGFSNPISVVDTMAPVPRRARQLKASMPDSTNAIVRARSHLVLGRSPIIGWAAGYLSTKLWRELDREAGLPGIVELLKSEK